VCFGAPDSTGLLCCACMPQVRGVGGNAWRTSHNAPEPILLALADLLGIAVMDENRVFATQQNCPGCQQVQWCRGSSTRCGSTPALLIWAAPACAPRRCLTGLTEVKCRTCATSSAAIRTTRACSGGPRVTRYARQSICCNYLKAPPALQVLLQAPPTAYSQCAGGLWRRQRHTRHVLSPGCVRGGWKPWLWRE
jgi:hypothetical protein